MRRGGVGWTEAWRGDAGKKGQYDIGMARREQASGRGRAGTRTRQGGQESQKQLLAWRGQGRRRKPKKIGTDRRKGSRKIPVTPKRGQTFLETEVVAQAVEHTDRLNKIPNEMGENRRPSTQAILLLARRLIRLSVLSLYQVRPFRNQRAPSPVEQHAGMCRVKMEMVPSGI